MRQKIWYDRWIVKFGERTFKTKHSLLCFYLILAMLIGVVYEGRKGETCEKVRWAVIIMPLQGDKASKATQTRQTQACNAFPSCDRVAWSFSGAHWPLPLSRSIMAHSLIVLLWLVVVAFFLAQVGGSCYPCSFLACNFVLPCSCFICSLQWHIIIRFR